MAKPKTICNVPGCPNFAVAGGRCQAHKREAWQGRTWQSNPYGKDWPKIRSQVLREEPMCRVCGQKAVTVDHIIPRSRGGSDDRSNLRPLCSACRRLKDINDAAMGRRLARE